MSRHAISVAAIVAVLACLALRMSGPYDLWDQTQPKTVSYTSDIVAHGRWILPVERGEFPATKPPLYNWLAAPAVAVAGYDSEFAHKLPSVLAMLIAAAGLWLAARRIGGERSLFIAGAAVIAFAANYPIYKLCWLARPDMVLTLWLTGGWIAATLALEPGRSAASARRWALVFWLCTGLAALTKGPAALVLPLYAAVHARLILGSWRSSRVIGWWWGIPLALAIVGWWAYAAWRTDPEHFRTVLWGSEIWGRVTGMGPEGNRKGPIGWVTDIYYMPLYFVARFAPWSILALMAMIDLFKRPACCTLRAWRCMSPATGAWMLGATTFIIIMVAVFTISTGKRADYIAASFVPGALLAAWRLSRLPGRWPQLAAVGLALCTLAGLTYVGRYHGHSPCPGYAEGIERFVESVTGETARTPAPAATWRFGPLHVQAMLGISVSERDDGGVVAALAGGSGFWVVGGVQEQEPQEFPAWLAAIDPSRQVRVVIRSGELCREAGWPGEAVLYWVEPAR